MRWMRVLSVAILLLAGGIPSHAASLDDATGRHVEVGDHITRVLPAGEPATALMTVLAPDLMVGWPHHPSPAALALVSPVLSQAPEVPHITETEAVRALHPDLILDYGDVDEHYTKAIIDAQAATGVPSVLYDGKLADTPRVLRALGAVLHRQERAEMLAKLVEAALPVPKSGAGRTAIVLRGPNAAQALVAGGSNSELLDMLGFRLLSPDGKGLSFRAITVADVAALNPDVIFFLSPTVRDAVQAAPEWRSLRAVREGHAWFVPNLPFGWLEGPSAVNRLLGLAWLSGDGTPRAGMVPIAAKLYAELYGVELTTAQRDALASDLAPFTP